MSLTLLAPPAVDTTGASTFSLVADEKTLPPGETRVPVPSGPGDTTEPEVPETTSPDQPSTPEATSPHREPHQPTPETPPTSTSPEASTTPKSSAPAQQGRQAPSTALMAGCQTYPPTTFQVCGRIRDKYNQTGGPAGFLLYPKSNELTNPGNTGKRTEFLGGNIYWSAATDAHPVAHEFLTKWGEKGYESGYLKYPTTDEVILSDGINRRQEYQGGSIYWAAGIGAHTIQGAIKTRWLALGGETGFLGFPTSDEKVSPDGVGRYNTFQHGSVYWSPTTGAWAVSGEVLKAWAARGYETGQYGYPTGAQTTNDNNTTVQQDFQGGTIKAAGPKIIELSSLMPNATPQQVFDDAVRATQDAAGSLETAVAQALQEVKVLVGDDDTGPLLPLQIARQTGDLVVSNAKSFGFPHGHTGIYVTTDESVHALSPELGVKLVESGDPVHRLHQPVMMSVNADANRRSGAAQWARTRIGSGYNSDFAFNRRDWKPGEGGTYNCSQLVWGAYMNSSNGQLDLDSNGGWGVYPYDITTSHSVTPY